MLIGEVSNHDPTAVVIAKVRRVDSHRAGGLTVSGQSDPHGDPLILKRPILFVDEQKVLDRVVRNAYIHPAIVVCIEQGDPEGLGFWNLCRRIEHMQSCIFAILLKNPITFVVIKVHVDAVEVGRLAIGSLQTDEG